VNKIYILLIVINTFAFFVGNYFKWRKTLFTGAQPRSHQDSEYNRVTSISSAIVLITLLAIIFAADTILLGIGTAVLMFVIVNPVVSGVLMNLVRVVKKK